LSSIFGLARQVGWVVCAAGNATRNWLCQGWRGARKFAIERTPQGKILPHQLHSEERRLMFQSHRVCKVVLFVALAAWLGCGSASSTRAAPACERGKGYVAIDASQQLDEAFLKKIKAIGINTVIRYYDWSNETLPGKTLTLRELNLLAKLEMGVAVIFQHFNDCLCTFITKGRGTRDAKRALELARTFAQPAGSAIYFGVDGVDAQFLSLLRGTAMPAGDAEARKFVQRYVRGYFEEVMQSMKGSGYKIGVYGSGLVCSILQEAKLADYCWLANATSWPGYVDFEATKRWVLKQHLPTRRSDCFGVEVDLNSGNAATLDFGQWRPKSF
jgi:hypothetical protein